MKTRMWVMSIASLLLWNATASQAGIYMGTGSEVPLVEAPSTLAPPDTTAPYLNAEAIPVPQNCEPFTGKGPMPPNACPGELELPIYGKPIVVTVHEGSLKDNVERIVRQAGWNELVWKPQYDYHWVGNVTITASDVQGVMTKLLEPYPLQAVFYSANHVVAVMPRRNT